MIPESEDSGDPATPSRAREPSPEDGSRPSASPAIARQRRKHGSVEILCREIGFTFTPGMEDPSLLIAFVRQLVIEVAEMRWQRDTIARKIGAGDAPSAGSEKLLDKVLDMLNGADPAAMVEQCAPLHDLAHDLNPDEAYPTDHLIDMLSSCISAIRFGCDSGKWGIGSRHAAAAAQHIWEHRYGVTLFDGFTPGWEKEWARHKLEQALVMMAFPAKKGADEAAAAQGMAARSGETACGLDPKGNSPVPEGDAP